MAGLLTTVGKIARPFARPRDVFEIDERFDSLEAWSAWLSRHPDTLDPARIRRIAARILATGFTEPLTRQWVAPSAIDGSHESCREGLFANGLSSRVRAVLSLIAPEVEHRDPQDVRIFAAEAVTPLALLLRGRFPRFLGAEYARDAAAAEALFPIPHQDLTGLTLPSGVFDLVTTNEVLEHVPDIDAALREMCRVLKPGGWHIGSFPFFMMQARGEVRSRLVDGRIEHLMPPEIHGNPVDPSGGSLVFETPGWDILPRALAAGFGAAHMRFVASEAQGFLTEQTGVFVLCARK